MFGPVAVPPLPAHVSDPLGPMHVIAASADAAAAAMGIDVSEFDKRIYVLHEGNGQTRGGTARPAQGQSFIFGSSCGVAKAYAHEFGHMLWLGHASTSGNTAQNEYGDASDVMGGNGNTSLVNFNAPHRAALGWLETGSVRTVTQPGRYRIGALGNGQAPVQTLVVAGHADATKSVYVSFRQAAGSDASLPAGFAGRTSVHEGASTCATSPTSVEPKTLLLGAVSDGQAASAGRVTVTQVSHDEHSALVDVALSDGE